MMDSILTDILGSIGILYLILHLWRSAGSLRDGIVRAGASTTQASSTPKPDLRDHPVVGTGATAQATTAHGRLRPY
jgi:hypothetical protein